MPELPHEDWCRLLELVYHLHAAESVEEARRHLRRFLPALLRQPCDIELSEAAALDGTGEARTGEEVPPGLFRLAVGHCILHLEHEPDERAACLVGSFAPHLELVCRRLVQHSRMLGRNGDGARITKRQRQVLALLLEGRSNAEIAYELEISVRTVEKHAASVMRSCGVGSRVQLMVAFHGNGMSRGTEYETP